MDTNTISIDCNVEDYESGADDYGSGGFSGDGESSLAAVPEPATNALMGLGPSELKLPQAANAQTHDSVLT